MQAGVEESRTIEDEETRRGKMLRGKVISLRKARPGVRIVQNTYRTKYGCILISKLLSAVRMTRSYRYHALRMSVRA